MLFAQPDNICYVHVKSVKNCAEIGDITMNRVKYMIKVMYQVSYARCDAWSIDADKRQDGTASPVAAPRYRVHGRSNS